MDYSEFCIISYCFHFPLDKALIVICKSLLTECVAIRHLEYLGVKILLLFRQKKGKVRSDSFFLQNLFCIFWQLNRVQTLLRNLYLCHVDNLCDGVVVFNNLIIEDVTHFLAQGLVCIQTFDSQSVLKLQLRE